MAGTELKTTTDQDVNSISTPYYQPYIKIIAFGYKEYQQTNIELKSGNEEQGIQLQEKWKSRIKPISIKYK